MSDTRFFLADLPSTTTVADLSKLFKDYGSVERIELKSKQQPLDDESASKFIAFVTLKTDDADYCLRELKWQRLHGVKIKVSFAKESFLDRLKREREEQQQQEEPSHKIQNYSEFLTENKQNKRRIFNDEEQLSDIDENDNLAPLFLTKKCAADSICNGKIVIQQRFDVQPLHVIEQHKNNRKKQGTQKLDAKSTIADMKRKESLNKMTHEYKQKKSAVQLSLAGQGQAKKIKFSDDEDENVLEKPTQFTALFSDDDEEDGEGFRLPEYKGSKGERLVQMQGNQSLDPRFHITANFVDEEQEQSTIKSHIEESGENEREWQLGILEQVVGRKVDFPKPEGPRSSKIKRMQRFDPSNEEHQKLLRQQPIQADNKTKEEQSTHNETLEKSSATPAKVSKNAFYVVNDSLKASLNRRGEGFSLLSMFGKASVEEKSVERQVQLEKICDNKILIKKSSKLAVDTSNPFSYESTDSENEDDQQVLDEHSSSQLDQEEKSTGNKKKSKKSKTYNEPFFFMNPHDPRLKEGAKFFASLKKDVSNKVEDYEHVRNRLKLLISSKIAKTKKNLPNAGKKKHKHKM